MIIWLYARLLHWLPGPFYARFGAEMLAVFAQVWRERPRALLPTLQLGWREFRGLLLNIVVQHTQPDNRSPLRVVTKKYFVPVWLLLVSLVVGLVFSVSYWGYIARPSSLVTRVAHIDSLTLVRIDEDYTLEAIPLRVRPQIILPDFPPSQILAYTSPSATLSAAIDPALPAALQRDGVDLYVPAWDFPQEPVVNLDGCGPYCFQPGVVPQADGTIAVRYPEFTSPDGQHTIPAAARTLTADDWEYYMYVMPAGYVVSGRHTDDTPLIFAAFASGAFANDRYRYHELIYARTDEGLTLRAHQTYNFDRAGLEGITAPVVTVVLFVFLTLVWLLLLAVAGLLGVVGRLSRRRVA